jgi:predicted RNase H-like nuclease (RuvC/YqgF family)
LAEEVERLRAASDERARGDHDRCVALYAQMERLARINQSVLHEGGTGSGGGDECERRRAVAGHDGRSTAESQDERLERLQVIVMEQAKELESLRRRRSPCEHYSQVSKHNLVNCTPGVCRTGNQQDEEEEERVTGFRGYMATNRSPVSLLAQLDAKDRRIHALEVSVSKMEAQLQQVYTKKLSAARESQQQLTRLQQHARKYEVCTRKQQHEIHTLEKKMKEMREYVDVLERKLVASSGKRDVKGLRF